ncbi:MAG: metallophosphoesterase [Patescibacteria group bacterium]|jgi:hypothetical protein
MKKLFSLGAVCGVLVFLLLGLNVNAATIQNYLNDWQFDFEAYGDTRTGDTAHQEVVNQMVPLNSDFVLHVGDLVNSASSLPEWQTFFSITANLMNKPIKNGLTRNFYPAVGNHEVPVADYQAQFNNIPTYYSFDYFGWHFISIDNYEDFATGSTQYNWLVNDLSANQNKEIIVWFHEPAYSSGHHGPNATVHDYLIPLFEQYGVAVVFNGHDHIYERTYPIYQNAVNYNNGIVYVVTGGGGAPLGNFTTGNWWTAAGGSEYEFVYLQATSSKLYANVVNNNGTQIDNFTVDLRKNSKYLMTSLEQDGRKNIKKFNTSGSLLSDGFKAYSKKAKNDGVRIASGDVNMDGNDELIVGSGSNSKSWVKVFDINGNLLKKIYPFKKDYLGGVDVAAGDVNGDNISEIAVSKFTGESSKVKIFKYLDKSVIFDRIIYPKLESAVAITLGDVDNDWTDELITGTGTGVRSKIRFYNILTTNKKGSKIDKEIKPFKKDIVDGLDVACGDINNDGNLDIGVSKLAGDKGKVKVFEYSTKDLIEEINVFRKEHVSGANLEMFDVNSDGKAEVIASQRLAEDSRPTVKIYDNNKSLLEKFSAYSKKTSGGVVVVGVNY